MQNFQFQEFFTCEKGRHSQIVIEMKTRLEIKIETPMQMEIEIEYHETFIAQF